jgi:hypothetical protein
MSNRNHDNDSIQEDEWGGGFQSSADAHREVQSGLRGDMVNQRNKTLALMVQVIRGEISKQKFKKLTGSSFDDLMKNAKWYINQIKRMPKSKLAPVAPAAPTAKESVDTDIQEAEKAVAPNDDELRRLLDAAKEILYGRGGGHSYDQRDAEAKKLVNKAKKFAMVTRNRDLLADWKDLNYHLKGIKVRKPKPNLNRSFGGVHDPRSYGRGGVADSYEAEGDDIQEATPDRRVMVYASVANKAAWNKIDRLMASLDSWHESDWNGEKKGTAWNTWFAFDAKRHTQDERKKVAEFLKNTQGVKFHHAVTEDIQEKVEIDGRTRMYRETVMRLDVARKLREQRMKAMQENRFGGLYDDGSGKGAMVPAPVDFNFHEAMRVIEKYRSLREKKKTLMGAPKEDIDAAVVMKGDKFAMSETELSPKQKEFRAFFKKALQKFGKSSPAKMDDAEKKKFFNWVEKNWKG